MIFIDLQTNSFSRHKVSIAISDREPDICRLLGNLPHQTSFRRDELVDFAKRVIATLDFEEGNESNDWPGSYPIDDD